MTSKSPGAGGDAPTPKDPPHDETAQERARRAAADADLEKRPAPEGDVPLGGYGVGGSEGLTGRPPGDVPHVVPGAKSPGPEVVPPAQTNAAEAELSRGETRPAGRAAPEADAKDEPKGGGMPGDVHPAVTDYERIEAEQGQEPDPKEPKK